LQIANFLLAPLCALCKQHPAMYSVTYRREARKVLVRMQRCKANDIQAALARVAAEPRAPNNNLRSLQGRQNSFRLRVAD
jgi:hypothetical protein